MIAYRSVIILFSTLCLTACGGSSSSPSPTPTPTTPQIGLPFSTSIFLTDLSGINGFYPYGPPRSAGDSGYAAISWQSANSYDALASADGVISEIAYSGGYRVTQTITDYSGWLITYTTLSSVSISEGETVSAGDLLGVVQSGGFEYFPLWWGIAYSGSDDGTCPAELFNDATKVLAKSFLDAWNQYIDDNPGTVSDPFRCYCYTYGTSRAEALAVAEADCQPPLE